MTRDAESHHRVVVDQPERQNLLGLLMQNILAVNLADESKYSRTRALEADVRVQAGEMVITLRFEKGRVTILAGSTERPKASVQGDMAALLGVASGGSIIGPFLKGDIRAGGNLLLLFKILPLIRRPAEAPHPSETTEDGT